MLDVLSDNWLLHKVERQQSIDNKIHPTKQVLGFRSREVLVELRLGRIVSSRYYVSKIGVRRLHVR